jgi:hypothetical protein
MARSSRLNEMNRNRDAKSFSSFACDAFAILTAVFWAQCIGMIEKAADFFTPTKEVENFTLCETFHLIHFQNPPFTSFI